MVALAMRIEYFVVAAVTDLHFVCVASQRHVHAHTVMVFGRLFVCRSGKRGYLCCGSVESLCA